MKTHLKRAPEAKAATGDAQSVAESFEEFMEAFEAFKQANDERLAQVESRVGEDVVTMERIERINSTLDEQKSLMDRLMVKGRRPGASAGEMPTSLRSLEHKQAFDSYLRGGREDGLRRFEAKALSYSNDADGGYLVPDETATEIGRRLSNASPIRSIAGVQTVSSALFKKPFAISGPQTGWVAETDVRPETGSPALSELQFPTMELYAMPAATAALLEDAAVDVDAWLALEVEQAFAEQESAAFVNGDGVNKPRGFMSHPTVEDTNWSWGNLGTVSTGSDGAFADSDVLIDCIYALKAGYRQNASFVMNRKTQGEVRKLKDSDGNYLWTPPAAAGQQAMLMGFPVVEAEDMPDISVGSNAIAFGDFSRGYLIVDRAGVRILRDPYSAKPYVLFYTTKRVGGDVQDFDAIKLINFGA